MNPDHVNYKVVWADGSTFEFRGPKHFRDSVKGRPSFLLPTEEFPCLLSMANVRYISETVPLPPFGHSQNQQTQRTPAA